MERRRKLEVGWAHLSIMYENMHLAVIKRRLLGIQLDLLLMDGTGT